MKTDEDVRSSTMSLKFAALIKIHGSMSSTVQLTLTFMDTEARRRQVFAIIRRSLMRYIREYILPTLLSKNVLTACC